MSNYPFLITTDSGCDLQLDYCRSREIIPYYMHYVLDGQELVDEMTEKSIADFYDHMRSGKVATTTQVNPAEFVDFWTPLLEQGKPILHISLSGAISGTYSNALVAVDLLKADYPDARIVVVNSTTASAGYGAMCVYAADMRDAGKSIDEIADWLNKSKPNFNAYYTTPDLTYLQRGGRVSKTSAFFGGLLSINPILDLDVEGHLKVCDKVRGNQATIDRLIDTVSKRVIDPKSQTLFISHADCPDRAKEVSDRLRKELGFRDVFITNIGVIIGSHTGPGLVAVFFIGQSRE